VLLVAIVAVTCVLILTRHAWWIPLAVVVALPDGPREWEEYQAQKGRGDT
jgi:hypothetical protein